MSLEEKVKVPTLGGCDSSQETLVIPGNTNRELSTQTTPVFWGVQHQFTASVSTKKTQVISLACLVTSNSGKRLPAFLDSSTF